MNIQMTPSDVPLPPQSEEAEQALLAAALHDNKALEKVADFLKPEHFYNPIHQRIYQAMQVMVERGQVADALTLKNYVNSTANLDHYGGLDYLAALAGSVVSVASAGDYGRSIHDLYLRRQLIELGDEMQVEAHRHELDSNALDQIEQTEKRLYDLAETGDIRGGFVSFGKSLSNAIEMAEAAMNRDSNIVGVTSGLIDMDRKMGGLHKSDLLILAGRPSMGKTSLVTNIAYNAASRYLESEGEEGAVVGFFSLEMSAEQLATRVLADVSRVPSEKIRRGEIKAEEFSSFVSASQHLSRVPLFIDDTPALSVTALRTRARRLKRQHKLGLVIVDYLQLLTSGGRAESRVLEISEITRNLKALAKELDLPVIALSQLSRAVEQREDKRPQLSDLRESGSIEQDADVVMFVYRQQYYLEREEPVKRADEADDKFNERYARWQTRCEEAYNIAEVIIAKQRHGPIGTVRLHFDGQFTKFSDLDPNHIGAFPDGN